MHIHPNITEQSSSPGSCIIIFEKDNIKRKSSVSQSKESGYYFGPCLFMVLRDQQMLVLINLPVIGQQQHYTLADRIIYFGEVIWWVAPVVHYIDIHDLYFTDDTDVLYV